ncbi:MAG: enoyl-CoA hydratase [Proteobacteria bacterium]|nr:enoyl-CoA hydratase [Pseudomonadota bacterium]
MDLESVIFEARNGYGVMKFNRPESLNALDTGVFNDMRKVIRHVAETEELRALMITGCGRGFCAGADLKRRKSSGKTGKRKAERMGNKPTRGELLAEHMMKYANRVAKDMVELEKPIVAAVNGVAAGAGIGIALSCDMVIAAKSATFVQVFAPRLGVVPDMGCTWFMPRLVGRARALGLMFTGEELSAEKAVDIGLIWKCVEDADLMEEAMATVAKLAKGPTRAFAHVKKAVLAADGNSLRAQLDLEAEYQGYCVDTEDNLEGVIAFIQKRKPVFKGC